MNLQSRAKSHVSLMPGVSILLSLAILLNPVVSGRAKQKALSGGEVAAIRGVLTKQVAAWNERRLEHFMDGYWKSPELSFFSGGNRVTGWDATLERYRKNYQSEGREMGKLAFSELDVRLLGVEGAVVRGRFELTLANGSKPTGLFTLILRKFGDGWKIIHDHTSTD